MSVYPRTWSLIWFVMMMKTSVNCVGYDINETVDDEEDMVAYGTVYDSLKYPYVIHVIGPAHMCTGSLIQPLFVLTAAHCTWGMIPSDMKVSRGHFSKSILSHDLKRLVRVIYQHEEYKHNHNHTSDISLLEVYTRITAKRVVHKSLGTIDTVKLSSEWKTRGILIAGTPEEFVNDKEIDCVVIGFGRRETQVAPKDNGYQTDVVVRYGQNACAPSPIIRNDDWRYFLCSKPDKKMVCHGDSGGPLICGDKQYGSAKGGYNYVTNNATKCGTSEVQTRHIFLYMFKEWIDEILNTKHPVYQDCGKNNAPTHRQYLTIIVVTHLLILTTSGLIVHHSTRLNNNIYDPADSN